MRTKFQSTPPVWGATWTEAAWGAGPDISIHAPRVGGDCVRLFFAAGLHISIHAPRVGGDARDPDALLDLIISIHAPRVGGDPMIPPTATHQEKFQSTPPVWGATTGRAALIRLFAVFQSTPPVWGATPSSPCQYPPNPGNFNPRPPCGGRREAYQTYICDWMISIHAPRVGGDHSVILQRSPAPISIHAPRVGGDLVLIGS